jgi:histidinol-phosphate aminotransferase
VAGAYVSEARPGGDTILGWDATALRAAIRSAGQPKMVWFANPANPTGQYVSQATVEAILTVFDGLLVLDEAYRNFVAEPWPSLPLHESGRVVLVRSMTKDYALAGLRLGYVVAHPTIIAHLRRVRVPWSVNALAQAAGLAALQSESFLIESRARLLADRVTLVQALEALGWACVPTDTHFFLTRVPAPWPDAATVREALLRAGLMVRDCTSFGLPRHIRLATRRPDENERIVQRFATITL